MPTTASTSVRSSDGPGPRPQARGQESTQAATMRDAGAAVALPLLVIWPRQPSSPMLFALLLIACGLLAASNLITARRPGAQALFLMVAPFAGLLGLVLLGFGVLHLLKYATALGPIGIATCVLAILLGFLQSFGLIGRMLGTGNRAAMAEGERLRSRLATVQIPLGITGIALGVYMLI